MRRGAKRLEVIIGCASLTVLLALLIIGIVHHRERTRRSVCQGKLRRVGQALESYVLSNGRYPMAARWTMRGIDPNDIYDPGAPWPQAWPNITAIDPGAGPDNTRGNWAVELLPHLGRQDLFALYHPDELISSRANRGLRSQTLREFRCPSDSFHSDTNRYRRRLSDGSVSHFTRGNYAINGGGQRDCAVPGQPADPCPNGFHFEYFAKSRTFRWWGQGVAGINKQFRPAEIRSKRSRFVVVDEIRAGVHPTDPRGVWALGQIGGSITFGHGINGDAGQPNCPHPRSDDIAGCERLHEEVGSQFLARQKMGCCWYCRGNVQATARSMHPFGVNTLTASGTVRFVGDTVAPGLWHVIHSRESAPGARFHGPLVAAWE